MYSVTEQRVLGTVRGVPVDAASVVRTGLQGGRDPCHHPAGHELQLPAVRSRGARHGRVRERPGTARLPHNGGVLRPARPFGPVQHGRHVRGDVLEIADGPVLHVRRVQGGLVRDAPEEAEHQPIAAAQARLRRTLHQSSLQHSSLTHAVHDACDHYLNMYIYTVLHRVPRGFTDFVRRVP